VNTAKPSAVSAARVNATNPYAVSATRVNAARLSAVSAARIKPSAGNPQQALKDKGVIDSGCSRHMTGNISYLSDFEELNGGYVTFGGNPKGGKITGKDLLLPIPFWAEAVNTACYVQNRVLVTKPHNKTPYELLHGRLPSIGFMRPFSCSVTILNTLDPLGKFQGKVNEGFLVGYSICSKAFRVFNSRTRFVQETLHVNFMENKPNVAGSGPAWLFDIDREEGTQTYVLFHVLSDGSTNPKNNKDDHTGKNEHNDNIQKSVSPDIHSSSFGDQAREQGDKVVNKDKGKNPVVTITGFRDLNEEFADCINNNSNGVSAAGPLVFAAGLDFTNSTNDFTVAGPLVSASELNFTNSTNDLSAAGPLVSAAELNFTNSTNDLSAAG
nr:retrovirus-related Pol polyprotein from transposon TNT 1-94 [Tanacetum cinerariifolium]